MLLIPTANVLKARKRHRYRENQKKDGGNVATNISMLAGENK